MKIAKIRRVGNSNVVTLPRVFEQAGYVPGTEVLLEELPDGRLLIQPVARRPRMSTERGLGARQSEGTSAGSTRSFFDDEPTLDELAAEQGVGPVTDFDNLLGNGWPEDDDIDDFLATLYAWRDESKARGVRRHG